MDTIAATSKGASLASPKIVKNSKGAIVPSSQMAHIAYGCEHMGAMFEIARNKTVSAYNRILQTIHEKPSVIAQTYNTGSEVVSLRPMYLCLQCPNIMTEAERDKHVDEKRHVFAAESREGNIYCGDCQDFIYDPDLEAKRLQKGKKRKFEDTTTTDEHKLIINNSTFLPCRAIGLRGLYNMGQTCFMSVILQTLMHNPFIRNFYLSEGHKAQADCEREACVSCALDEIFVEFHSAEKTEGFGAVNMLMSSWLAGEALAGYQQQDAHEYMQFMLNTLHLQNGGSPDSEDCSCIIHQTFSGKLSSTVTCDNCRNTTTALDPYMDLSLDVRNLPKKRKLEGSSGNDVHLDLRDCLDRFTGREKLGAAEYTCRNCDGGQNAIKQLSIKRLPPVLSIHLKRFEHTKSTSSKIETKVSFPLMLDLYPYTTEFRSMQPKASKTTTTNHNINSPAHSLQYELSAVIVHKGKLDSGHYVNYSREGDDWFAFDDSKVVLVSEAEVLAAEAYLLFYMIRSLEV
ncbi:ubiquitin carboxyl-terminal hydrolase-like protein 22 [Massarina eburnea CBS 473.64]|uniref:Ubiquitin carboxyl-terminal hydrolase n=1 Tax=Massarina eburnea CBS 473.64 TaxID=1395130 RepID=A0A6A6S1X3_9PLEO|nr:ubiquitin carboxyl-terminal hydrolase-like protein 22 [Massarina eburnea CBS 473.64]